MRNKYTGIYSGMSASQRENYGKTFTVYLKDVFSEDGEEQIFTGTFGSMPKKLKELKPARGELFEFYAEAEPSVDGARLLRPTKFKKIPFEIKYEKCFGHLYKNFEEGRSFQDHVFAIRLFRRFPDEAFWKQLDIGFKLNSLGFFFKAEELVKLEAQYKKFKKPKFYQLEEKEEIILEKEKVGEDLKIDYSKKRTSLLERFKKHG